MGSAGDVLPVRLRCAVVLRTTEHTCEVHTEGAIVRAGYPPQFPTPRGERVSPGNLVALATAPDGAEVVIWRWYDAVVLGDEPDRTVRLWEPAHGEVAAQRRPSYEPQQPGTRAYLSSGLPGAQWWVAGKVTARAEHARVDLDDVARMYTARGLWAASFGI